MNKIIKYSPIAILLAGFYTAYMAWDTNHRSAAIFMIIYTLLACYFTIVLYNRMKDL